MRSEVGHTQLPQVSSNWRSYGRYPNNPQQSKLSGKPFIAMYTLLLRPGLSVA